MSIRISTSSIDVRVNGGYVLNRGPQTLYYRSRSPVSSVTYDGTIGIGASVALDGVQWFCTASGASYIEIVPSDAPGELYLQPPTGEQALRIRPSGAVSSSTSVGGAVNVDNSLSTGAGVVVYTSRGADATGRLVSITTDDDAFPHRALSVVYKGTTHGVFIDHQGNGSASIGLNVISSNTADTTLGVGGLQTGRGVVKVKHTKPDGLSASNASALSIDLEPSGTGEQSDAQGIFMDAPSPGTTGKLAQLRNGGTTQFYVGPDGTLFAKGPVGFNGATPPAKPTISGSRGGNAALAQLLSALASMGIITDSSSA